jgi:cellulose biosynthesis protein BcsQ
MHRYVVGLDLGLKNDRTVMTVAHAERRDGGAPLVVLDRIAVLEGTRARPVQLADVEALAEQTSLSYGHARIRLDPWQAVGLAQRLRDKGVTVEEWTFSAQSVGRLGKSLHLLMRDHRLALPDDRDLLDELVTVRLRKSAPGVFRLDHDAGQHDDRAVSLGLAALALVERPDSDEVWISSPGEIAARLGISRARKRSLKHKTLIFGPTRAVLLSASRAKVAPARQHQRGTVSVITFFNHKGGVGKTTLLFNVGIALAGDGRRVLFVDADPQANLTGTALSAEAYAAKIDERQTIYHSLLPVIRTTGEPVMPVPVKIRDTAWIIPGHILLSQYEESLANGWSDTLAGRYPGFQRTTAFWRVVKAAAKSVDADIVLIDVGPSVGALNRAVLLSSDGFVVPLSPDLFSLTALPSVGGAIENWTAEWAAAVGQAQRTGVDAEIPDGLPIGTPAPIGYISQQFASYRSAPAAAFKRWLDEIPGAYKSEVADKLRNAGIAVPDQAGQIGTVRNLSSLVPMAQEANSAIFELTGAEARGAQYVRARDTLVDFLDLGHEIENRIREVQ